MFILGLVLIFEEGCQLRLMPSSTGSVGVDEKMAL